MGPQLRHRRVPPGEAEPSGEVPAIAAARAGSAGAAAGATAAGAGPPPDGALRRQLGFFDVAALHVGTILGSGIFVAPAAVAAATSRTPFAAALWILGGFVAACGAMVYAECGSRLPRAGGFYVYYREVYGPALAFVGGWAALLVTYPASTAAIALVFGHYLGRVVPALEGHATIAAAGALLLTGAINAWGVRLAAMVQRILSGSKIAALAILCLAAAIAGSAAALGRAAVAGGTAAAAPQAAPGAGGVVGWAAVLGAMVVMLWTYDGWSDIGLIAGEVRDPKRTLGRAVLASSATLAMVYALVQASVLSLLPAARAAGSDHVVAEAVETGLGAGAAILVASLVALCTFGSVHSIVLGVSRLGYAMGADGAFLRFFAHVDPRLGTPARSTAVFVATTLVYVVVAPFRDLLGLFSFSVWIFYGITAAALLVLRRRRTGEAIAWRAPGGILAPAVVLATAVAMTTGLATDDPRRSSLGLLLLLSGFGAYAVWRRLARPAAAGP